MPNNNNNNNNNNNVNNHPFVGGIVLVRAQKAGVHCGRLESYGNFVHLAESRRVWSWSGAFSCSELAVAGPASGRIADSVPNLTIPIEDVGEIILMSQEAWSKISKMDSSE